MRSIILVAHNIRSCHNVGSLFRTAEGLGVDKIIISGYTPYPSLHKADPRMPHEASRVSSRIAKTALGSENMVPWYVTQDLAGDLLDYSSAGYTIAALEQTKSAIQLPDYAPPHKIVLLLGNELMGVDPSLLEEYKTHLVIPMYGQKESFNVVQAAAMTLFWLRFAYNR